MSAVVVARWLMQRQRPEHNTTDSERSFVCCRLTSAEPSVAVYSGAQWMIGTSFRQGPAACAR